MNELRKYATFSVDLTGKPVKVNRMFSLESNVEAQNLRTGQLNDEEWDKLIESAGLIGRSKLLVCNISNIVNSCFPNAFLPCRLIIIWLTIPSVFPPNALAAATESTL